MSDVQVPQTDAHPGPTPKGWSGLSVLIVLVGLCGALFWGAFLVRDQMSPMAGRIRALRSSNAEARQTAAQGLVGLSPEEAKLAVPALRDALGDSDEQANLRIIVALGEAALTIAPDPALRPEARSAIEAIIQAMTDARGPIRFEANRILGLFALVPPSDKGPIYDPDPTARTVAQMALTESSLQTRLEAAQTLFLIAKQSPLDPPAELAATLTATDKPGELRGEAASLIGAFLKGRDKTREMLVAALKDADPKVRWGAAVGLAALGPDDAKPALAALVATLAEPVGDPARYRTSGLLILRSSRSPNPIVTIVPASPVDPNPQETYDPSLMAAQAVGVIASGQKPDEEALGALIAMLAFDQPWRREAAASVLNRVGRKAIPAVPAILEAFRKIIPDADSKLSPDLIELIGKAGPRSPRAADAVGALIEGLSSPSELTTYWSIITLANFGALAAPALPTLQTLTKNPSFRIAAKVPEIIAKIEDARSNPDRPPGGGRSGGPGTLVP